MKPRRFYLRLLKRLVPWEPTIYRIESVLVWERPLHTLAFVVLVNAAFWYVVLCDQNTLFLWCVVFVCALCIDFWKNWLLPKIKAVIRFILRRKGEESKWRPSNARLLNVYEICMLLDDILTVLADASHKLATWRRSYSVVFFLLASTCWMLLAYIGTWSHGSTLLYLPILAFLVGPSIAYHRLVSKAHVIVTPMLERVDQELDKGQLEPPDEAETAEAEFEPFSAQWRAVIEREIDGDESEMSDLESLQDFIPASLATSVDPNSLRISPLNNSRSDTDDDFVFDPDDSSRTFQRSSQTPDPEAEETQEFESFEFVESEA